MHEGNCMVVSLDVFELSGSVLPSDIIALSFAHEGMSVHFGAATHCADS